MYDLLDRFYTDIVIQPARKENGNKAFCDMVDRYAGEEKTIFIVDRGYESYNNIVHVLERNSFFLFRAKEINNSGILSGLKHLLPVTSEFDVEIKIILTRKCTNEVVNHPERYKCFHKKDYLDYIDLKENPFYKMKFRVLRFPISGTGYECVITNLPADDFSAEEIKKLYAMRCGIETSFRELKYAVALTGFHAKKREIYNSGNMGTLKFI